MTDKQALVDEIVKDLVKWFFKHRKPITSRSLRPILKRRCTSQITIDEMALYLTSKEGNRVFHQAMEAALKSVK